MFWGRAMGWYAMALVDVLDYFPKDHPKRTELISILNREMAAVEKVQDKKSGLWWLILDMPGRDKKLFEASAAVHVRLRVSERCSYGLSSSRHYKDC